MKRWREQEVDWTTQQWQQLPHDQPSSVWPARFYTKRSLFFMRILCKLNFHFSLTLHGYFPFSVVKCHSDDPHLEAADVSLHCSCLPLLVKHTNLQTLMSWAWVELCLQVVCVVLVLPVPLIERQTETSATYWLAVGCTLCQVFFFALYCYNTHILIDQCRLWAQFFYCYTKI